MCTIQDYQGILFDFDGVLCQSMEDNFKAWQEATTEYGLTITREDYFPLEGMPVNEVAEKLFKIYGLSVIDSQKVAESKDNYYIKLHQFKLYPGVTALIDSLAENQIPIGIVTAANKDRILKTVPGKFLEKFNELVTGDMTEKGKPFPDPYLKGCRALGIPPEKCIVIENAPLGIQAAKDANTYCIAICSTLGASSLHEADKVIDTFEQLGLLDIINPLIKIKKN